MADSPEVHLFIIWSKARSKEREILEDLYSQFDIISEHEVTWSQDMFGDNLTRFYGTSLPSGSYKEEHCGTGPFLAIVVADKSPRYDIADTSKGPETVNMRTFNLKQKYRELTGGGHRIHATNSTIEADHDLTLLFGKNSNDFMQHYERDALRMQHKKDLVGARGWETIEELFYVMNNTMSYVVLRNFEALPEEYTIGEHGDIDILVDHLENASFITKATPLFEEDYRIHKAVTIGGEEVRFDFRFVGDNYYDPGWEASILANKELDQKGFYRPSERDYFFTLLYHAVIHKAQVADDYIERLVPMAQSLGVALKPATFSDVNRTMNIVFKHMKKNDWYFIKPDDLSVYYDEARIVSFMGWRARHRLRAKRLVTQSPAKTIKTVVRKLKK